jgi:hypothetical protein
MKREEQKLLINKIRELARGDVLLDTLLRMSEIEVRTAMYGQSVSQDYMDDALIDTCLFNLLMQIIPIQAIRINELQGELMTVKLMSKEPQV